MLKAAPHILSIFDNDLDRRASVGKMDGRVETAVAAAIERTAVHLIAARSPLADDLREVPAAFKIAGLIARMGDCASSIARRAGQIGDCRGIAHMGEDPRSISHGTQVMVGGLGLLGFAVGISE